MSFNFGLMFPYDSIQVMNFWQEYHRSNAEFIASIICPITSDVDFDHLVKVVSARFLHCKVTILPF